MKLLFQAITLALSCGLVALVILTSAIAYLAPILGLLILISAIGIIIKQRQASKKAKMGISQEIFSGSNLEVFVVTTTVLLIIFLTGGLYSNLFFLLYFIMFGLVFLFEPPAVFVLLIGLLALFYPSLSDGDLFLNFLKLGTLVFLTPLSFFFGREFQKRERLEQEIRDKAGQIIEDTQVLRTKTKKENKDTLDDIEKQAEDLKKIVNES
jgi:hypothetical protein